MCINSSQIISYQRRAAQRIRNFTNKGVRIRIKKSKKSADQDPYSNNVSAPLRMRNHANNLRIWIRDHQSVPVADSSIARK